MAIIYTSGKLYFLAGFLWCDYEGKNISKNQHAAQFSFWNYFSTHIQKQLPGLVVL